MHDLHSTYESHPAEGRAGVSELLALVAWLALLVAPWAVHVMAVSRIIAPELFWLSAPLALFGVLLWTRGSGGEGLSARGTLPLCANAGWLVVQTVAALVLFVYHGLDEASRWLYALWVVAASVLLFGLMWRQLRSGSSRRRSRPRPA